MIAEARKAFWVMVGVLAALWIIQIFNALDNYGFSFNEGLVAHNLGSLPHIFTAPFLHWNWAHIEANSGPLFIFGFLAAYRGVRKFVLVSVLIIVISGVGAWLFSTGGVDTVGASGVVFGYFGYIIVRGLFDRHRIDIAIGLVMALCFAYQFTAFLPNNENVSWQGHVSGFVAGILGGWFFRDKRPKAVKAAAPAPLLDPTTTLLERPKES
jgi:membrane associated rhomboid family serine protease